MTNTGRQRAVLLENDRIPETSAFASWPLPSQHPTPSQNAFSNPDNRNWITNYHIHQAERVSNYNISKQNVYQLSYPRAEYVSLADVVSTVSGQRRGSIQLGMPSTAGGVNMLPCSTVYRNTSSSDPNSIALCYHPTQKGNPGVNSVMTKPGL